MEKSVTPAIERLINALKPKVSAIELEGKRMTVHPAIMRFSVFYEKLRMAIDYQESHLHRRSAISRILKRQLTLEIEPVRIAQQTLRELIAARYLQNDHYAERMIHSIAVIIEKYLAIKKIHSTYENRDQRLLSLIVVEIEELIIPHYEDKSLTHVLTEEVYQHITVADERMTDEERKLQLYIAVLKTFAKADLTVLTFKLLRIYEPRWIKYELWQHDVTEMASSLERAFDSVELALAHPQEKAFTTAVRPWAVAMLMLKNTLQEDLSKLEELLQKPDELRKALLRVAESKSQQVSKQVGRGVVRAIIYLFLTKVLFALVLEYPLEMWLYGEPHKQALLVNALFPPVLMFFVWLGIRPPKEENSKLIVEKAMKFVDGSGITDQVIRVPRQRSQMSTVLLGVSYAVVFCLIFGLICWGLSLVGYTWVSMLVFLFFLCVVSFFAYRLRTTAKVYTVLQRPEGLLTLLIDMSSLPILRVGKFLNEQVSRYNIIVLLFDVLLEAPYKLFLEAMEEWFYYMKEKKDQL